MQKAQACFTFHGVRVGSLITLPAFPDQSEGESLLGGRAEPADTGWLMGQATATRAWKH